MATQIEWQGGCVQSKRILGRKVTLKEKLAEKWIGDKIR